MAQFSAAGQKARLAFLAVRWWSKSSNHVMVELSRLALHVNVEVHARFWIAVILRVLSMFPMLLVMPVMSMLWNDTAGRREQRDNAY